MDTIICRPTIRSVFAGGLIAVAGMIPSASISEGETIAPRDTAAPDRLYLAQAGAEPLETLVSYSAEQADRGEEKYESECEECHGDDLKGGLNGGAPIRGLNFESKYADGAPASYLFEFMSTAMPPNSPGRYSESTYADLMAFVLKRNGFKDGAPLPTDLDALDNLIMEK